MNIHKGSILECDVDVIVNPANSFLYTRAGLAKVIHTAASDALCTVDGHALEWGSPEYTLATRKANRYAREVSNASLIPYGGALLTSPGCLPFKGIIHVVGPIWGGGDFFERPLLFSAYSKALSIAERAGYESIAFPAISAGIFGCPIAVVAQAAELASRQTALHVVHALMEDAHVAAYENLA